MKLKPYIIAFSLSAILAYNTMLVSADSTEQPIVLGYTLYGTSTDSLKVTQPAMNQVSTDNFFFYADGTVQGEAPKEVLSYSQKNKIKIYAALSNFNNDINYFDENLAHNVLSNSGKRTKLINQIYNIVVKYKYDGVNIDLENIKSEDRDLLTTFVKETSKNSMVQVILLWYRFLPRMRMIVRIHGHGHLIMLN
ncbi:hypothetical protein AAHB64_29465 [Bacillus toyonensis]